MKCRFIYLDNNVKTVDVPLDQIVTYDLIKIDDAYFRFEGNCQGTILYSQMSVVEINIGG